MPVVFIDAICIDSQRYLGAMLPYLHHPPVADTLAQIVCVSHLASAHGGVGPQATLSSSGSSGGGLGGVFGGMGGGMFGSFGMMGGGGFGGFGGGGDRQPESPFAGQLTLYGQRGVAVPPAARLALWRSLSPWGFLAVLASHVHRAEYAPVRGHATAAVDVLLHIVRLAAADAHGDLLLAVLGTTVGGAAAGGVRGGSAVMRALARGASWPKPGVDFPAAAPPAPSAALYCAGGDVPERQRECMRVAAELVRVSFVDQVPAAPDAPGSGMGANPLQPPRMVDNRLARSAQAFASALVAFLPQIGFALCRVNAALAGPAGAAGLGRRASTVLGSGAAAAAGAKKKRNKKKKGGAAAQAAAAAAGGSGAVAATGVDGDEDDDEAVPLSSKLDSPSFSGTAERERSMSSATMQTLSLDGASPTHAAGAGRSAPGRPQQQPAQRASYRHPGHEYPAPFGMFRLYAAQLLAQLVQVG